MTNGWKFHVSRKSAKKKSSRKDVLQKERSGTFRLPDELQRTPAELTKSAKKVKNKMKKETKKKTDKKKS